MRSIILLIVLSGCPSTNPGADAGSSSSRPSACAKACANLTRMQCDGYKGSPGADEVYGTADDISCTQVCSDFEAAAKSAPGASLHPDCLAAATSCTAAKRCLR